MINNKLLAYISLIFITIFCYSGGAFAQTVSIGATEYSPFTTSAGEHGGFVNRVISESFKRKGYDVKFNYYPWKRALELGRLGKIDGVSFSFKNPDRENDFVFSNTLSEHRELFFHLKSTKVPKWGEVKDLSDFKFGATRGYTYTREFWDAANNNILNVQVSSSDEQNFKKLGAKRIDLFPMDEITGWTLLNKLPTLKDILTVSDKALRETSGHLILGKKLPNHKILLQAFNEGLAELKADGTYDQFIEDLLSGEY